MKKMSVEKYILVNDKIDQLLNLNAQENLRIQMERDGKRCVGYVDLKGQYLVDNEVKDFREYIECDIFAPIYKCTSDEFEVVLSYTVFDEYDVILRSAKIKNVSDEEMKLFSAKDVAEKALDDAGIPHADAKDIYRL